MPSLRSASSGLFGRGQGLELAVGLAGEAPSRHPQQQQLALDMHDAILHIRESALQAHRAHSDSLVLPLLWLNLPS